MFSSLFLCAALLPAQVPQSPTEISAPPVQAPPSVAPAWWAGERIYPEGNRHCHVDWLRHWGPEDLHLKPFEPVPTFHGCKGLFWCSREEKNSGGNGQKQENGQADKKNDKKNGNGGKENGNGEKQEEEEKTEEETETPCSSARAWRPVSTT